MLIIDSEEGLQIIPQVTVIIRQPWIPEAINSGRERHNLSLLEYHAAIMYYERSMFQGEAEVWLFRLDTFFQMDTHSRADFPLSRVFCRKRGTTSAITSAVVKNMFESAFGMFKHILRSVPYARNLYEFLVAGYAIRINVPHMSPV
jgi:hypothetical protein